MKYTFRKNDFAGLNEPTEYLEISVRNFWTMYDDNGSTCWSLYELPSSSKYYERGRYGFVFENYEPQFATLAEACVELAFAFEQTNVRCQMDLTRVLIYAGEFFLANLDAEHADTDPETHDVPSRAEVVEAFSSVGITIGSV